MNAPTRPLGRTGAHVSVIGFGAVKIGRASGLKYPTPHDLPDDAACERLLNGVVDLGINLIDTAPAYGISEERIGRWLAHRREGVILSTKVGETFDGDRSVFDFSADAVRTSVERSLKRLRTDRLDVVLIHSDGNDRAILESSGCVESLLALREAGRVRWIGLSGKTVDGARLAMAWADVLMVPYNIGDAEHRAVIDEAERAGVGVLVKKALGSGHLDAAQAIRFSVEPRGVSSVVVGSLSLKNIAANVAVAADGTV